MGDARAVVMVLDAHVVSDPEIRRLFELLTRIAPTRLPVLVLGETGAGKEAAAEWIHTHSGRPADRFVKVNCASLSESMVESELFGHERGAFTGATSAHEGFFEAADGGTLLLDEVGELPLRSQAKLLRVLETGEIVRVGSTRPRRIDVRVVTATHRDLPALVQRGEFRQDLFFRLDGLTLTMPRLRDRPCELLPLARLFIGRTARELKRSEPALGDAAEAALRAHPWPGNIRELRNVVARAVALCQGEVLLPEHLALDSPRACPPAEPRTTSGTGSRREMRDELRAFERAHIVAALVSAGGNQTRAAARLGVSRRTLTNKLNAYTIERPRKRTAGEAPELRGEK
jgi:two-component system, NtrC family, response regulator AtoC